MFQGFLEELQGASGAKAGDGRKGSNGLFFRAFDPPHSRSPSSLSYIPLLGMVSFRKKRLYNLTKLKEMKIPESENESLL